MKRTYKAERVTARAGYLGIQVTVEVGTTLRFVEVKVPWSLVADAHQGITEGMERVFLERIRRVEDHLQPRLPGID